MKNASEITFNDIQGLVCNDYDALTDTCFMLLNIKDIDIAKAWIKDAPITNAIKDESRSTALQIAFSVEGLEALKLSESLIEDFSDEFIDGMTGDESRSRRLGDVLSNTPEKWKWGGQAKQVPHVLLLLYARENGIESWRKTVEGDTFIKAFQLLCQLPTLHISDENGNTIEPFGFRDGVSQPGIDWESEQSTDFHERFEYSNLLAPGEVVLGYPNEYGRYTRRPLLDPEKDRLADQLPNALDEPELKDFGRNGTFLVLRQLKQDVPRFWQFIDQQAGGDPVLRENIAAAMVGRKRDVNSTGNVKDTLLVPLDNENIPGASPANNFTYKQDPQGELSPIGSHVRRTNPRNGDLPAGGGSGFISQLLKIVGFGSTREDGDLIASTRFHRMLRRGRAYGPLLKPDDAIKPDSPVEERGLQFICLVANISRQFEFVQNAWSMSSKFAGLQNERDPLLGHRESLMNGENTDQFNRPDSDGPVKKVSQMPQFITVRGGGYFFMPGLSALKYIATNHTNRGER